ncbi:MGMT family protein [Bacillus sp. FJAT-49736]|uniref:MGMT family protein n=1 Tax=Bacillus sp. FJAT-49736 TaxID=2833582 RepID=UPI001BC8FC95|nr:MGMT family protein [Bacillus sp. FJAT-49736]MBS4174086.1 MGMT family protein [Bacillus sp. FJAT-49736]
MSPFTEAVIRIIRIIPEGRVMTYGQIAALAGSPRGARQVARILHSMSKKHKLPWHRVISSKGEISLKDDEQKMALQMEGIEVHHWSVNLSKYQFHPGKSEENA